MYKRYHTQFALLGLCLVALASFGADALGANVRKHHKSEHHRAHHAKGTAGKTAPEAETASDAAQDPAKQKQPANEPAAQKTADTLKAVEAVETVEAVEATAATPSDTASAGKAETNASAQLSGTDRAVLLLGHMHTAAVHLPIAWVLLWLLFDLAAIGFKKPQLLSIGPALGAMATLSFLPAVVSGLLRLNELSQASADVHTMDPALQHRNLMYWALGLCALTYLTRKKALTANFVLAKVYYTALIVICFAIVGFSAHLGGQLVYGEEFLQF